MEPGFRSPLIDFFRRGEVARDVRLLAAQGALAPRAQEQLALLVLLRTMPIRRWRGHGGDAGRAAGRGGAPIPLPRGCHRARCGSSSPRAASRSRRRTSSTAAGRGRRAAARHADGAGRTLPDEAADPEKKALSSLSVLERMKLAMKGTREQRAVLVRDSNKLVSAAVLSSPKVNEAEIETFTKMGNVSEDVLRVIGQNRALDEELRRHPRALPPPEDAPAIAMSFVQRLNERDLKALTTDRNAKEGLRLLAKKMLTKGKMAAHDRLCFFHSFRSSFRPSM